MLAWPCQPGLNIFRGVYHELWPASYIVGRYFAHRPYRIFFTSDGPISGIHYSYQSVMVQGIFAKTNQGLKPMTHS
jgi:hypothetical protein